MIRLLSFLLLALTAAAQTATVANMGVPGTSTITTSTIGVSASPIESLATNQSGYPVLAWFKAENYSTNTTPIWTESWTNGWHLTNLSAASFWPTRRDADVNGYSSVRFEQAAGVLTNYLKNAAYTSAQPHEVWMVIRPHHAGALGFLFDSVVSSARNQLAATADKKYDIYAGTADIQSAGNAVYTNSWVILDSVFLGASSILYTNNVTCAAGNAGANAINGLTVGARYGISSPAWFDVAEVISYGGTFAIPGTNTVARSNVHYYLKTKYGL